MSTRQPTTPAMIEDRGDQEHAAADRQVREPEIDAGQDERGGPERLHDPDEQLAAVDALPQVVEIGRSTGSSA